MVISCRKNIICWDFRLVGSIYIDARYIAQLTPYSRTETTATYWMTYNLKHAMDQATAVVIFRSNRVSLPTL